MLYVMYDDINDKSYPGVKKKILAQLRTFERFLGKSYLSYWANGIVYLMENNRTIDKTFAPTKRDIDETIVNIITKYNIRNVYVRYKVPADIWFIEMLRELNRNKAVVVVEVPTYPYDMIFKDKKVLNEDHYYIGEIKKHVSLCSTYSDGVRVFDIETLILQNGIDLDEHPIKRIGFYSNKITVVAVATFDIYHGYERAIEGLYLYEKSKGEYDINLCFVGEGSYVDQYKALVDKYRLHNRVQFCGVKTGIELDELYDKSDLGLSPLGLYRIGLKSGASIKTREYCARALPFLYAYDDVGFSGDEEYVVKIDNSPAPLDMKNVVKLYERTVGKYEIQRMMREKAQGMTWDIILEPICNYFRRLI